MRRKEEEGDEKRGGGRARKSERGNEKQNPHSRAKHSSDETTERESNGDVEMADRRRYQNKGATAGKLQCQFSGEEKNEARQVLTGERRNR